MPHPKNPPSILFSLYAGLPFLAAWLIPVLPLSAEPVKGKITAAHHLEGKTSYTGQLKPYELMKISAETLEDYKALKVVVTAESAGNTDVLLPNLSFLIYSHLEQTDNDFYQGRRLSTKALKSRTAVTFLLPVGPPLPAGPTLPVQEDALPPVQPETFPLYFTFIPFSKSPSIQIHYTILPVYRQESQVYLLLKTDEIPLSRTEIDRTREKIRFSIDGQEYTWQPAGDNSFYTLPPGKHLFYLSLDGYYAEEEIEVARGKMYVTLTLQPQKAEVQLLAPREASILIDGLPLVKRNKNMPVWEGVTVRDLSNRENALSRIRYDLQVPPGRYWLTVTYEEKNWGQEVFFSQDFKTVISLDWSLEIQTAPKGGPSHE